MARLIDLIFRANTQQIQQATQQVQQLGAATQQTQQQMNNGTQSTNNAASAMSHLNFSTVGARRELIVLAHEAATGNWRNFAGSIMVLAEQVDAMSLVFSAAGLAAIGAAAAVGTMVAAYIIGGHEIDAFNKSLAATNNYAGLNASKMLEMASIANGGVSRGLGEARDALAALNATGEFTGPVLQAAATAAIQMAKATGISVEEASKMMHGSSKDVSAWAVEMNNHYHNLTFQQYEQITALQKAGDTNGALKIAMESVSDSFVRQNKLNEQSAGWWDKTREAMAKYWNVAKTIGADPTIDDLIKNTEEVIAFRQGKSPGVGGASTNWLANMVQSLFPESEKKHIASLQAGLADLKRQKSMLAKGEGEQSSMDQLSKWQIDASREQDQFSKTVLVSSGNLAAQTKVINEQIDALKKRRIALGTTDHPMSDQEYNDSVKAIKTQFDKKSSKGGAYNTDPFKEYKSSLEAMINLNSKSTEQDKVQFDLETGKLSRLKQQLTVKEKAELMDLAKRADTKIETDALTKQVDALNKQTALADKKGKYAQLEYDIESGIYKLATDQEKAEARKAIAAAELVAQKQALKKVEEDLTKDTIAQTNSIDNQIKMMTMTKRQQDEFNLQKSLELKYEQAIEKLKADGNYTSENALGLFQKFTEEQKKQLDNLDKLRSKQEEFNGDWKAGVQTSLTDYLDNVKNVNKQAEESTTRAFQSMEDALVNFAMTGKLSFGDLAKSIISDLVRIQAKSAMSGIFKLLGSAIFGNPVASSGDYAANDLLASAKGNVFGGGSLMAFANGVVTSPTYFPMANGGTGLMGEAGPEAIMPLTRGKNGKLGVQMSGDGGSGTGTVVNNITVNVKGGNTNEETGAVVSKAIMEQMKAIANQQIANAKRPGGLNNPFATRAF